MRTIGDKIIKDSSVVGTLWEIEKEINIEFHNNGELEFDLDIVLCYNEDQKNGEKIMTMVKVNEWEVTDEGGGSDFEGHLNNAIYTVLRLQFQEEASATKDKWVKEVRLVIEEALESEDLLI